MMPSRRAVLKGLGAGLTLPWLEGLAGRAAHAQAASGPRYYVHFCTEHGGIWPSNMYPAAAAPQTTTYAGRTIRRQALTAQQSGSSAVVSPVLTASAARLTPSLVAKMNVIQGLDVPYRLGHHFGGHLGNLARAVGAPPAAVTPRRTIDQVMAYSPSFYPSLSNIRQRSVVAGRFISQGFSNPAAQTGAIADVVSTQDSRTWFDRLFPPGTSVGSGPAPRPPVVDLVIESYRRLKSGARLSAADQVRLDEHLQQLAEVQRRLQVSVPVTCTQPARAASNSAIRSANTADFDINPLKHAQYFQLLNDVVAAGMACDLTRVVVVRDEETHSTYAGDWHQDIAHQQYAQQATLVAGQQRFFADVFVDLAAKLDAISDGRGGTLLDHTLMVWTQEHGNQTHHSRAVPVVTFGGAGGFFKTGQYVDYRNLASSWDPPGTANGEFPGLFMHQLWGNALTAMGVPRSEWAEPDHGGYGARYAEAYSGGLTLAASYPDTLWSTTGDPLPFLT